MEIILELLVQFFVELFIQGLFEFGGRGLVAVFKSKEGPASRPLLAILGYLMMGTIAGGISIWLIPMHLLQSPVLQILNLTITPILLGLILKLSVAGDKKMTNTAIRLIALLTVLHSQ